VKTVSNASVLIGLSSIGKLSLLRERFPSGILIPEAVRREVVDEEKGDQGHERFPRQSGSRFKRLES